MIIKTGRRRYWSTGITLTWTDRAGRGPNDEPIPGWSGSLDYLDDGWVGDDNADTGSISTEGTLRTRYAVVDGQQETALTAVIDALIYDAEWLGVEFGFVDGVAARLYYRGDGEDDGFPPPEGWRELLAAQAERIGWETYGPER